MSSIPSAWSKPSSSTTPVHWHVSSVGATPAHWGKKSGAGAHHGHGLFGKIKRYSGIEFANNLGEDIGNTALGVGPGLWTLGSAFGHDAAKFAEHPGRYNPKRDSELRSKVVVPAAKGYADYYGHNVLSHLYNHPLQPILDALTLASGGAGAAAKVGKIAADAGLISKEATLAKLGERATIETRSPRNVATGEGPVHTDITSNKPLVKARELAGQKRRASEKRFGSQKLGDKYGGRVERRGGELQRYGAQIQAEANRNAVTRLQTMPGYMKAVRHLSGDEWTALHIRAMDIHPADLAELWKGTRAAQTLTPKVRELAVNPSKRMVAAEPALRGLSEQGKQLYQEIGRLKEETAAARPDLTKRQATEQLGRPVKEISGDPYYFPHVPEPAAATSPLRAAGGGKAVPRPLGSMKQNQGVLALSGKLHLRSDVLGPEFLRRVKFVKYDEIHNALMRGAVPFTKEQLAGNGGLPKGWEYLRRRQSEVRPLEARHEGDQIPLHELVPNPGDLQNSKLAEGFSTTDPELAATGPDGHFLIVPKSTVRAATGEFTRSSNAVHLFVQRPLSVWRAVILGLRAGFLTNNLVGNSIMYAAKTGGRGAIRDLFGAILETHGAKVAKEILDNPVTPEAVRRDLYAEFFPEQMQGTFGRTQSPSTSLVSGAASKGSQAFRATTGVLPKVVSKVAEEYPRKALIRNAIRRSPEFRKVYRQLPRQTRTFTEAARKVLAGEGGAAYQRLISKQVNHALGDYLHLSPFERNVLRNTIPFYSWYRAISTTTYHLAVDTPLRADILRQLGEIGKEWSDKELGQVPSWLRAAIPFGGPHGGVQTVLATQGLNPYATLEQIRRGSGSDLSALGLNPFLQGPLDIYAQKTQRGKHLSPGALLAQTLEDILTGLPPYQLARPQGPSRLYPKRNRTSTFYGFLGLPIKQYDVGEAAKQAGEGR